MRVKPVPAPPGDLDRVDEARRAVPLVPKPEADCCSRIAGRLGLAGRDEARTWLTFLRGLGLVERTDRGFARARSETDRAALAAALLEGVYGAEEVRSILEEADGPLDAGEVFGRFERRVPAYERHKAAWRDTWRGRVEALLGWLVLLGRAERTGEGYAPA